MWFFFFWLLLSVSEISVQKTSTGETSRANHIANLGNTNVAVIRKKRQECKTELKIHLENCQKDAENRRYTYFLYYERLDIKGQCAKEKLLITWKLQDLVTKDFMDYTKDYKMKTVLMLPPNKINYSGKFQLSVEVKRGEKSLNEKCTLKFMTEPPIIIFPEGPIKYVESKNYEITIAKTKNFDKRHPIDSMFTNVCNRVKSEECKLADCPTNVKGLKLIIRLPALGCYTTIKYTANVKYEDTTLKRTQIVSFVNNLTTQVVFECLKNCDVTSRRLTNVKVLTHLKLHCTLKCEKFPAQIPPTFKAFIKGKESQQISGLKSENLVDLYIPKDSLDYGKTYYVMATNFDVRYQGLFELRTQVALTPPTCDIQPREGMSSVTLFYVTCTHKDTKEIKMYPHRYSVFQVKEKNNLSNLLLDTAHTEFSLIIGAIKKQPLQLIQIVGTDMDGSNYKIDLPKIKVVSKVMKETEIIAFLDNIDQICEIGDYSRAVQLVQGLILDMIDSKLPDKVVGNAYTNIINSLNKISVDSIYSYKQIASILPIFQHSKHYNMFSSDLGKMCKQIAKNHYSDLAASNYVNIKEDDIEIINEEVRKCADVILEESEEDDFFFGVTDPAEVVSEPTVNEDYANYEEHIVNAEVNDVKVDAIETLLESSKITGLTLTDGEEREKTNNNSKIIVFNQVGKLVAKKDIEIADAVVSIHSVSKAAQEKSLTMHIASYSTDALITSQNISTGIVEVAVMDGHTMSPVEANISIILPLIDLKIEQLTFNFSTKSNVSSWNDPDMQYNGFNVHRMYLPKESVCFVDFFSMPEDQKLLITFTNNRRTTLADFRKFNYTVDGMNNQTFQIQCPYKMNKLYDRFIYLSILPHPLMIQGDVGNVSLSYTVGFVKQECLIYDKNIHNWIDADCKITMMPDAAKIKCDCTHTSLFGGRSSNLKTKLDTVSKISFKITKDTSFIIFIHVAAIFFLYCIALGFTDMRSKSSVHKDKIIFLSDNLKNDLYGYLLVVKTGNISSAGTTSNVMIQLFAENCTSLPHVLNYPDPDKSLLQRGGEDWLVLTCEKHLGEIKYIQIWFDGVGFRPTWYCEEIYVIDLQTHKEWNFQVDKWFTLRDVRSIEYTIPAKVKEIRTTINHLHKRVRFYVDGEHTWNIFTKSHDHVLSYPQRLTVLLSMIITTYTFGILLLSPPTLSASDSFGYGEFIIDFDLILIPTSISLITCLINLPMVYLFRNSYNRVDMYSFFNIDKRYPVVVTKLVWCIITIWIAVCMIYLLMFGYFITKNSAYFWIFCTYSSIVMSIFIFENIYLIVFNILMHRFSKVTKTYYDFKGILREIEMQRKTLFKLFGETLLRPYFQSHYQRWELDLWKKMALLEYSRWEVMRLFHDFCIFLIYLLILYVVSFTGYGDLDYLSSKSMYNMMEGKLIEISEDSYFDENEYYDFSLTKIKAIKDIYDYLNNTLVQNIHPVHWYGNFFLKDGGQMIDFNTKILGVVKLRQQRRKQVCNLYSPLNLLPILCSNDNPTFRVWKYDNGTNNTLSLGKLGFYDGTGYVQNLGRTIYNTYYLIAHLKRVNWIDINTKVLIIDFWTYNVNYNIFNMVQVLIERDLSGHIVASEEVFTVRLLYATKFIQIIVTICCLIFIVTIIIMIGRSIVLYWKQKKGFFKDFWHVFDIILFLLGVIMISLFVYRHKIIKKLMDELRTSNNNHFVNYFPLVIVGRANVYITAILLSLATIRLWKFLRFAKVFQIMERTIRRMSLDIFIILTYHCFIYFIFALYLHIMFGDSYELFRTIPQTITTLFLISLNFFDHFDHEGLSTYGSTIYLVYSVFMISSVFFTTIYCTIIIIGFEESKIYFSDRSLHYTILDHIKDESIYYREIYKRQNINLRLKAGSDNDDNNSEEFEDDKVTPKEYCKRYADCFTMTNDKMLIMRLVAISIIKLDRDYKMLSNKAKRKEIVEANMELMARITLAMMKPISEKLRARHIFFSGKDPIDNSIRFVSNDVIMQIEYVVKSILEPVDIPSEEHDVAVIHSNENEDRLTKIRDRLNMIQETIGNIRIVSK